MKYSHKSDKNQYNKINNMWTLFIFSDHVYSVGLSEILIQIKHN